MLWIFIKRNIKLFFKDKGMFLTSLITPVILLVLYTTFLGDVYRDSFAANLPEGMSLPEKLLNGLVGGQLVSSLLAVCSVTVAFCSNFLSVQDKANGSIKDLRITPVKASILSLGYYIASLASTLLICLVTAGICLGYLAVIGWYLSVTDVLCLLLDVVLVVLFGTAVSSVINLFLSSQGQISAVGTVVSSGYGFVCGAYMPVSSFSPGLQKVISFLPGTYGTALMRNHAMQGALAKMGDLGVPVETLKDSMDCNLYFFQKQVSIPAMYAVLAVTIAVLIAVYILLNTFQNKKRR